MWNFEPPWLIGLQIIGASLAIRIKNYRSNKKKKKMGGLFPIKFFLSGL